MKQRDIKLLWGRAANRCSLCRRELSHEVTLPVASRLVVGEQAHIVAEEPDGPRGESVLSVEERNAYANMILLCPTCHTTIDKAPAEFPVELLHARKTSHELWVGESLSGETPDEDPATAFYAHMVDLLVEAAQLPTWENWTSFAIGPDQRWCNDASERVFHLQRRLHGALWPGTLKELERAMQTFGEAFAAAFNFFADNSTRTGDLLYADRFYKIREWDPERYHRLHARFVVWSETCDNLLREAARAANWFADVVRRDLNPRFYHLQGRFLIIEGPNRDLAYCSRLYEYSQAERRALPTGLRKRLRSFKAEFETGLRGPEKDRRPAPRRKSPAPPKDRPSTR